jgi:hypothetical protein
MRGWGCQPTYLSPLPPPPGNTPGTHFCYRLSSLRGPNATGRIMVMKNFNAAIWNRTRDLLVFNAVHAHFISYSYIVPKLSLQQIMFIQKEQNLGNEKNSYLSFLYQTTALHLSSDWSLDTTRITILQLDISGESRRTVSKSLSPFPRGRNFYSIQLEMTTKTLIYEMSNRITADIGTHVSLMSKRFSRLGNLRNEGV